MIRPGLERVRDLAAEGQIESVLIYSPRSSSKRERPKQEWIEIAVPAIIDEKTFALAAERLEQNKRFSARRTIEPTLLSGKLVYSTSDVTRPYSG